MADLEISAGGTGGGVVIAMSDIVRKITNPTREEVIAGYEKQIAGFEKRIRETRDRIHKLRGQTTLTMVCRRQI